MSGGGELRRQAPRLPVIAFLVLFTAASGDGRRVGFIRAKGRPAARVCAGNVAKTRGTVRRRGTLSFGAVLPILFLGGGGIVDTAHASSCPSGRKDEDPDCKTRKDFGSCGNACCAVDLAVPKPPTEVYEEMRRFLESGGADNSYRYVNGPDASGNDPSDMLPDGVPNDNKYIFQGTHKTSKYGYVDSNGRFSFTINVQTQSSIKFEEQILKDREKVCPTARGGETVAEVLFSQLIILVQFRGSYRCLNFGAFKARKYFDRVHGALGDNGQNFKSLVVLTEEIGYDKKKVVPIYGCGKGAKHFELSLTPQRVSMIHVAAE
eukprot:jgi/Bigna1/68268/fgenesh1_pg.5_\